MTAPAIFKRPQEEYKPTLDYVQQYIVQIAGFVSKTQNIDMNTATTVVKDILKVNKPVNPIVVYNFRNDNGDMSVNSDTLRDYLKNSIIAGNIIVPSFTTYMHQDKQKSVHSIFLAKNKALRKSDKKNAFKYKQLLDKEKEQYFTILQKVRKVFNNSLSGAYASKSTILYNPSAHYSLTSITRCVASIGNAVSESVVAGNKHFRTPDITMDYILAVVANVPMELVEYVIKEHNLYLPTPTDVLNSVLYSSRNYWTDATAENTIYNYLTKCSPVELAAILYVNDLHHVRVYNEEFTRDMLSSMSEKHHTGGTIDDINNAPEGVFNFAQHICMDELRGVEWNIDKLNGTTTLETVASTVKHTVGVLIKYKLFLKAFFTTDIMPVSIAYIKDMLRDAIVLSDTDSTCASYDAWVNWYFGAPKFSSDAIALASAVMLINTQLMDHHIKLFAKNMNIKDELVNMLKMKNEYYWLLFITANVSKHYFADVVSQEGNIYANMEQEVKGVHLIASSIDQRIVKIAADMRTEITDTVTSGKLLDLHSFIKKVADIERELLAGIQDGKIDIYKTEKIKESAAYKHGEDASIYHHHILWLDVFKDKYGDPGKPTYAVAKVPAILDTKGKLNSFINSLEDTDMANNFREFISKYKKDSITTFRLPISVVDKTGVPKEILRVVDTNRIVLDNCNILYIILETIGFYRKPNLLISEMGY